MVKILLVIPYAAIMERFERLTRQVTEKDIEITTVHIYGTDDALIRSCSADIVIARGMTAEAFRQSLPHTQVVQILMTSFDIMDAIARSVEVFGPKKIALCLPPPTLVDTHSLETLAGMEIVSYGVNDEADILRAIREGRKAGAEVFIGGLTMCRQCDVLGLSRIHIKTSDASVERAIEEAVNAARTLNQERAKTTLVEAVLNNSAAGIFAVNSGGEITAANKQAYLFCRLPPDKPVVGRPVDAVCPRTGWQTAQETGMNCESLQNYDNKLYYVHCKPILVDNLGTGVLITLENAAKIAETETKIRKSLSEKGLVAKYTFDNIIGASSRMKYNISIAHKYAAVDSNVLLIGETGTGKELFAHSIHNASSRSAKPFVAVNCAALPENLLESELFGYSEGAFSGARKGGKIGLFELAHQGTIFLDEIGEVPISLQAKLLRVLQEREIRRVGDSRVIPVDVRVISATNINIAGQIAAGHFRADLYYRLNLLNIHLSPLRERREDIPPMVRYFLERYAASLGKPAPYMEQRAMERLCGYSLPGNARELRNLCERFVVLCENGVITEGDINMSLGENAENPPGAPPRMTMEELARSMGVSRTTLWRRMKKERQPGNDGGNPV